MPKIAIIQVAGSDDEFAWGGGTIQRVSWEEASMPDWKEVTNTELNLLEDYFREIYSKQAEYKERESNFRVYHTKLIIASTPEKVDLSIAAALKLASDRAEIQAKKEARNAIAAKKRAATKATNKLKKEEAEFARLKKKLGKA